MERCKYCGSINLCKAGFARSLQKYKCKVCKRLQVNQDARVRFEEREKSLAITLYLEGNGFRRIARILSKYFSKKFCYQTIVKWVKKEWKSKATSESNNDIEILEMDELFTYVKKNKIESRYGLLLIETGCVLLNLKLEKGALNH